MTANEEFIRLARAVDATRRVLGLRLLGPSFYLHGRLKRECEAEQRRRQPRAKKPRKLSEDDVSGIVDMMETHLAPFIAAIASLRDEWERRMIELAPRWEHEPTKGKRIVSRHHTGTWSSQGLGADSYAFGAAKRDAVMLIRLGYEARVETVPYTGKYYSACPRNEEYRTVANCTGPAFRAAGLAMSARDAAELESDLGLNPLVNRPFMDVGEGMEMMRRRDSSRTIRVDVVKAEDDGDGD